MAANSGHSDDADPEVRVAADESVDEAPTSKNADAITSRRRLLKLGAYTAPAVAGTLLVSKDARAQEASCIPYGGACSPEGGPCIPASPCSPDGAPCAPEWFSCLPDVCLPTIFG